MMFAAYRDIPVITWAPWETHYRRSSVPDVFGEDLTDWTHPFISGLSDHVVDELEHAVDLIRRPSHEASQSRGGWRQTR